MKFIFKLSFLLLFIVGISSCNFKSETKTVTVEIDNYPTLAENEQFAKDILVDQEAEVLKDKFYIIDTKIKGANSKTEITDNKARIQFTVNESANSEEIRKDFISFFKEKEAYYKKHQHFLKIAERDAEIFLDWVNNSNHDAIWDRFSPSLKEMGNITKESLMPWFYGSKLFDLNHDKIITKRIIHKCPMPQQEGMCVTFIYEYSNGNYVKIGLEDGGEQTYLFSFGMNTHGF